MGTFDDEEEAARAFDAYVIANKHKMTNDGRTRPRNFPGEEDDDVVAEAARDRNARVDHRLSKTRTDGGDDEEGGEHGEAKQALPLLLLCCLFLLLLLLF